MKESTKKKINRLKPLIGSPIIRVHPTSTGNYAWTGTPAILEGFTSEGCLIVRNIEDFSGNNDLSELPLDYTDYNWMALKKARKSGHSPLNKWRGKKVRRTVPAVLCEEVTIPASLKNDPDVFCLFQNSNKDTSFMEGEYILVHASKHHVFLKKGEKERILDFRYANPAEWELAE